MKFRVGSIRTAETRAGTQRFVTPRHARRAISPRFPRRGGGKGRTSRGGGFRDGGSLFASVWLCRAQRSAGMRDMKWVRPAHWRLLRFPADICRVLLLARPLGIARRDWWRLRGVSRKSLLENWSGGKEKGMALVFMKDAQQFTRTVSIVR